MARATYLRKRSQGWSFRRAVPQDLQSRFGLREIVRSLAHVPQSRAAYEARVMGFACEDLFMEARQNTSISLDQLKAYGRLIVADKMAVCSAYGPPLRMRGVDRREEYENYREVATVSAEAAADGRAVFDPVVLQRFATEAAIKPDVASAFMPLLQNIMARATAGYCIKVTDDLHTPVGMLRRMFSTDDVDEQRYQKAKHRFEGLGPVEGVVEGAPGHFGHSASPASLPCEGLPGEGLSQPSTTDLTSVGATAQDCEPEPAGLQGPTLDDDEAGGGQLTGVLYRPPAQVGEPSQIDETPILLLFSAHWTEFVETKIATREWKESRRAELSGTLRLFLRLIGDVSLLTFTREDATLLRKRFFCLPSDHKNMWFDRKANCDRTFDDLIAYVAELDKNGHVDRVGTKTWNKQCGNFSSYIKSLRATVTAAKSLENHFEALVVPIKKNQQAARLERAMAPEFALRALIATEVWTGRKSLYHLRGRGPYIIRDSLYWIPLMEICLGLRREEGSQLRVRHLTVKFEILGINLFAADVSVKEEDGASRRWVPLSTAMLELGFVDCLLANRDPDELLFPELSNKNAHCAYGVSFGKRFSNYVKRVEPDFSDHALDGFENLEFSDSIKAVLLDRGKDSLSSEFREKVSNHGIRHWFRTMAENTDSKTIFIDELMGHEGGQKSEGERRYFKVAFIRNLKATVDKVPVPFDPKRLRQLAEDSERRFPGLVAIRKGTSRTN